MPEYDPMPVPTGAQWDRDADNGDRAVDAYLQERTDSRLTSEEKSITVGCLAIFITQMRRDMNLNPDKAETYRKDMRAASSAIAKLQEWVS